MLPAAPAQLPRSGAHLLWGLMISHCTINRHQTQGEQPPGRGATALTRFGEGALLFGGKYTRAVKSLFTFP